MALQPTPADQAKGLCLLSLGTSVLCSMLTGQRRRRLTQHITTQNSESNSTVEISGPWAWAVGRGLQFFTIKNKIKYRSPRDREING